MTQFWIIGTVVWWAATTLPAAYYCHRDGQQRSAMLFGLSTVAGSILILWFAATYVDLDGGRDALQRAPFGSYELHGPPEME